MSVDFDLVFDDDVADLFDLISFRLRAARLQVDDLVHAFLEVDLVATFALAKGEACAGENETQVAEIEVRVGATFEQCGQGFLDLAHD